MVQQRWMLAELPADIRLARAAGQVIVQDVDDWFFGLASQNLAARALNADTRSNLTHYRRILSASDLVVTSTPYLASRLSTFCPRVVVVRNHIDADEPGRWGEVRKGRQREQPVLGWAGAVPWRSGDLETLRGIVGQVCEKKGVAFHHSGHIGGDWPSAGEVLGLTGPAHTHTPMATVEEWPAQFAAFDVGIVPLSDRPFNEAKCLDAEVRVATHRGLLRLRDVKVGDEVWAGTWRSVLAVVHEPATPGAEIETFTGRKLRLTMDHRLWVNGSWGYAGDIRAGDRVALAADAFGSPAVQTAPWPADSRISRSGGDPLAFQSAEDAPTVRITERWARFFGLLVGDGSVSQQTTVTISCDGQDADLIHLIMDDLTAIGLHPTTEAVRTFSGQVLRRRSVRVASAHLVRFLANLGLVHLSPGGVKQARASKILTVPDVVWCSPEPIVAAFLAGLFEADGTVDKRAPNISLTTKEQSLALSVQRLLNTFGIAAEVTSAPANSPYADRLYWKVRMRRAGLDVFAKRIRFLSERKNARLDDHASRPHSNAYRPMIWEDGVVLTRSCLLEPVDIQVEGEVFAAGGFLSHNSAVKGMEYTAAGKPFVAQGTGEYRWLAELGVGRVARRPKEWIRHLGELLGAGVAEREAEARRNLERLREAGLTTGHLAEHWLEGVCEGLGRKRVAAVR